MKFGFLGSARLAILRWQTASASSYFAQGHLGPSPICSLDG